MPLYCILSENLLDDTIKVIFSSTVLVKVAWIAKGTWLCVIQGKPELLTLKLRESIFVTPI